jgi:hypothetical protein
LFLRSLLDPALVKGRGTAHLKLNGISDAPFEGAQVFRAASSGKGKYGKPCHLEMVHVAALTVR